MLNRIVLMGRLTRDPELRRTQSGTAVVSFSIACDRDYAAQGAERETDFMLAACPLCRLRRQRCVESPHPTK